MKTLLQLVNAVLPEIGFPQVSTVVGNANQTARLALSLANRHGQSMSKHDWRILVKRNVITTVAGADSYSLPSDFDRFIHDTEWNETSTIKMDGPLPDDYWQADLSGLVTVTINNRFQVRADGNSPRLFIRPVPTAAENVTFFYISNAWCRSGGGQRQSSFVADTDVLLLDDFVFELGLKWRMLQAQKRSFEVELAEYTIELGKLKARDGGVQTLRLSLPQDWTPQANTGETGFGA